MIYRNLSIKEAKTVYDTFLVDDFPPSERKPFTTIKKSLQKGQYICCAAFDEEDHICGYAFFLLNNRECLLDYFAIRKDLRGTGVGSDFLKKLGEKMLPDISCVLVEIDNPMRSSGEEKRVYERRLRFYLRNGFIDTGVEAKAYGVEYRILELPVNRRHSVEEVKEAYAALYHSYLPETIYAAQIHIR